MSGWEGKDRRRHPRVGVDGEVSGRIQTATGAPVVDISVSGVLLELPCALQASTLYKLRLSSQPAPLELSGRVVRSYVHGFKKGDAGETQITYRAAIQFEDVTDEQKNALDALIANGQDLSAGLS